MLRIGFFAILVSLVVAPSLNADHAPPAGLTQGSLAGRSTTEFAAVEENGLLGLKRSVESLAADRGAGIQAKDHACRVDEKCGCQVGETAALRDSKVVSKPTKSCSNCKQPLLNSACRDAGISQNQSLDERTAACSTHAAGDCAEGCTREPVAIFSRSIQGELAEYHPANATELWGNLIQEQAEREIIEKLAAARRRPRGGFVEVELDHEPAGPVVTVNPFTRLSRSPESFVRWLPGDRGAVALETTELMRGSRRPERQAVEMICAEKRTGNQERTGNLEGFAQIEHQIRFGAPTSCCQNNGQRCQNNVSVDRECRGNRVSTDTFGAGAAEQDSRLQAGDGPVFAPMGPPIMPLNGSRNERTPVTDPAMQSVPLAARMADEQLVQLVAENARLRARAEAREEMTRLRDRFQQAILQLRLQNAELLAQQELAAERQDLMVFEASLAVEKARMQAHVKHVAEREEMLGWLAEAAIEKAQLEAHFESAMEREEMREAFLEGWIETASQNGIPEMSPKTWQDREALRMKLMQATDDELSIQGHLEEMAVELEREKAEKTRLQVRVTELERLVEEVSVRDEVRPVRK